ncbi:MAG: hypothetical protein IJ136_00120 [Erysipelotrichaceae bacterium]|nr:hypothetical protein [Erysipelotrichaceae bacterium]
MKRFTLSIVVIIALSILLLFSGCSNSQAKKNEVKIHLISVDEVDGAPVYGDYVEGPEEFYNAEMIVYPEYPEEISDYLEEFKEALEPVTYMKWVDSAKVSAKRNSFSIYENTDGTICFVLYKEIQCVLLNILNMGHWYG